MISACQLADGGMKTTFDSNVCKITKGAYGNGIRQERTYPLHDVWFQSVNFSCFIGVGCRSVALETWAYEREGIKIMLSKDKLSGLKSIDLNFCEDCVYGKQRRVSFSKVRKTLKAERLELVHIDV